MSTDGDAPPAVSSNAEQGRRALADNGTWLGRQGVGAELDWTAAKTSRAIRRTRDAEEVGPGGFDT